MSSSNEITGRTLLNGGLTVRAREQNSDGVKAQQRVSPVWMATNNFCEITASDAKESVNNKIMVVHVPPPCSVEKESDKETLIAAVSHQMGEPFVMVDVEVANKKIESVPLSYECKLCDIKDELASNETVRVVFYLYENLQKQELQRCAIEDSERKYHKIFLMLFCQFFLVVTFKLS